MTVNCCADAPHICPGCHRVMSHREWDEQRQCNECLEGWGHSFPTFPTFYTALSPRARALVDDALADEEGPR